MLRSTHWDFASDFSAVFVISPQITRVVFGCFLRFKTCEVWPWHRFARRFLPQQWPLSWRQGALWDKLYKGSTSSAEGCLADMDMYIHSFCQKKTSVSIDIRDYRCFFFNFVFSTWHHWRFRTCCSELWWEKTSQVQRCVDWVPCGFGHSSGARPESNKKT